jgi:hypothetical protein
MGELSGAPGAAGGEGDGEAEGSRRSGPALGQDSRPGGTYRYLTERHQIHCLWPEFLMLNPIPLI